MMYVIMYIFRTSVKRLLNVIERLQVELNAEKELENDLQDYVKTQEYVDFLVI